MANCLICGRETNKFYSLGDPSLKSYHCKTHEIIVQTYVIELVTNPKFNAEKWLEDVRKNVGKTNTKPSDKKRR